MFVKRLDGFITRDIAESDRRAGTYFWLVQVNSVEPCDSCYFESEYNCRICIYRQRKNQKTAMLA